MQITMLAAGLAYYAFTSLIPAALLLFIGVVVAGEFQQILTVGASVLGFETTTLADSLRQVIKNPRAPVRATVIAGVIFLWSTGRMFQAIQGAFAEVYQTNTSRSIPGQLATIGLAFLTMALAVTLLLVGGVILTYVLTDWLWLLMSPVLLAITLIVVFLPMYYFFPVVEISLREAVPGAVFAAVAWTVSGVGFRVYATAAQSIDLYGLAGGVLLLLTWMYLGGLVLLVGAIVNAVLGGYFDGGAVDTPAG